MKNNSLIVFCLLIAFQNFTFAQSDINNYKYVSVSDRFDFLKTADQYQLNSLTKFLLNKSGFTVLDRLNSYPKDLSEDRCLLLDVSVEKLKGFLKTKLEVQFRNCRSEIIYKSEIGTSKQKDFQKAYHEALRSAFESVAALEYRYEARQSSFVAKDTSPTLSAKAPASVEVSAPNKVPPVPEAPVVSSAAVVTSVPPPAPKAPQTPKVVVSQDGKNTILVKATNYGFKVLDVVSDKVLYTLHATIYDGVFIIDNKSGIAYQRGNRWVREYVSDSKIVIEPLF